MKLQMIQRSPIKYGMIAALTAAGLLFGFPTFAAPTPVCESDHIVSGVSGFTGQYFNMSETDPGMLPDKPYYAGKPIPNPVAGGKNYWYTAPYYTFSRVDMNLNFGDNFFPINTGLPGDPDHFAVHWEAQMDVPTADTYSFSQTSNDDSWFYVDNTLAIDLNGIHTAKTGSAKIKLTPGLHIIDIYFADRARIQSTFNFSPDKRLAFYAVALPCPTGSAVINTVSHPLTSTPPGRVLGASTIGYTPAVALLKTATSPAIYAIFANGDRHYISSPSAFEAYGYHYNKIKTVSQQELDRHPEAQLMRTPDDPTIYFVSPRPNRQWLKIALSTPTVFVSYPANEWGNVAVVDALDVNSYPDATLVHADHSSDIYLLSDDSRHLFLSDDVMDQLGYNKAEILQISDVHLNQFALGDPIG